MLKIDRFLNFTQKKTSGLFKDKLGFILDTKTNYIYLISFFVVLGQFLYIALHFSYLPDSIPLWNFLNWGADILSSKAYIYMLPILSLLTILLCGSISVYFMKYNLWSVSRFVSYFNLINILIYSLSIFNIIENSTLVALKFGDWFGLYLIPALVAFIVTFITSKLLIKNASKLGIIEFPNLRDEPAKVLQKPTPRAGGVAFWLGFSVACGAFIWYSQRVWGLIIGTMLTAVVGYLDDKYKLSFLPRLLFVLPVSILIIVLSGFVMLYIPNPFGEVIKLDSLIIKFDFFGNHSIIVFAAIAAALWLMWLNQMLSFNNGIDGQFVAISSVTALVIGLLSFRFGNLTYEQQLSAQISFITLGALLGLFLDTFPPQKIIWGWGATGVGLIFAALSLLSGTRVASAFLVLLIPSVDVVYVLYTRIKNGKSPFKGDRNHLHHKLLDLGWSKRKITSFYWLISISFGTLTFFTSGRSKALTTLMLMGLALFSLIVFRRYADRKLGKPQPTQ